MGGVPIIGDVVETVTDVISPKKTTAQTRPTETAKKTEPEAKRDITRTLRRRTSKIRRGTRSLIGGKLFPTPGAEGVKDLSPIRNPRDSGSSLGS